MHINASHIERPTSGSRVVFQHIVTDGILTEFRCQHDWVRSHDKSIGDAIQGWHSGVAIHSV